MGWRPGDVYRTLRTSDGVDRAFRKLDQLKPYIVWWRSGAEAARILESGEVFMTSAPSPQIALANRASHRNFGMQWAGSLSVLHSWGVMKSTPNLRQAQQYLYFIGNSAIQAKLLQVVPYPGLAKGWPTVSTPNSFRLCRSIPRMQVFPWPSMSNSGATIRTVFRSASMPGWPSEAWLAQ